MKGDMDLTVRYFLHLAVWWISGQRSAFSELFPDFALINTGFTFLPGYKHLKDLIPYGKRCAEFQRLFYSGYDPL